MKSINTLSVICSGITFIGSAIFVGNVYSIENEKRQPNVIFILADDLGYSDLGCNGNPYYETPHIDKLASNGLRFTNAYSSCPVCSPTRASILTGKYPARLKLTNFIYGNRIDPKSNLLPAEFINHLPLSEVTIAERLREIGYKTGISGKWHLGENTMPEISKPSLHGFDLSMNWNFELIRKNNSYEWCQVGDSVNTYQLPYLTDKITHDAINFICSEKDHPFFLYVSHYAVHIPLQGKKELIEKYNKKINPRPGEYNPVYAAMVEQFDNSVGEIVAEIEKLDLLKNTIIIVYSDNGGLNLPEEGPQPTTNYPYRSGKGNMYEGGIRVPLIVHWEDQIVSGLSDALITSTDFFPTLIELASKGKVSANNDGRSFTSALFRTEARQRGPIYWHYPHFSNQGGRPASAIRDNNFKLIRFLEKNEIELYNLESDPSETSNIAKENPKTVEKMNLSLEKWLKEVNANMPKPKN